EAFMKFRFLAIIIFFIPILAFAQKITINKTSVAPGEEIEVKYSTGGLTKQQGWIGGIPSATANGKASVNDTVDVDYQYTSQPEGTMTFRAPLKAGSWDFRMNQSGEEGDKELASVTFQVVAIDYKAKLQINKTTFTPGEEISLTFSVQSQLPKNAWIGVIPSNIEHGSGPVNDQHDIDYQYVSEQKSGTLTFKAPEKSGKWDFRLNNADAA